MSDTFADGVRSVVSVLRPKGDGWAEVGGAQQFSSGFPARSYFHRNSGLFVISAVETMPDEDKGPEYHLSISKQRNGGPGRCSSMEARWALAQFACEGAEEDNHVPFGKVRNFWRPVAHRLVGLECECKAEEPAIVEDGGDFVWRPAP